MTNSTQLSDNALFATTHTKSRFSWEGAGWKIFSCACFAGINGVVRYLSGGASFTPEVPLPTNVLMFFQNVFGTLFLLPILLSNRQFSGQTLRHFLPCQHYKLHFLRAFSAVLGVALWYFALKKMPLAMAVALSFLSPIFTVLAAKLFLREKIGQQRAFAIFISLIGAYIISRPEQAFFGKETALGLAILLPLGSSLALVCNKLLTRTLTQKGESAESLAIYLLLMMAPVSFLLALPEWVTPALSHWPYLILLGLLAALAHVSFGRAYAKAEVVFLTPLGFSKFLFSTTVGYFWFLEIPKPALWIGMAVISVGILLLYPRRRVYTLRE